MESVLQDLRYSLRMILKQPRFFAILILTVALGIGANSMIFSVVNTLLLGPLPFKESDRLMALWRTVPAEDVDKSETSPPDFQVWREQGTAFEGMAGYFVAGVNFAGASGEPDRVQVASASANLFNVLGVEAAHGRLFRAEEEQFGNHRVVIISDGLWKRQFGASQQALGQKVELDGEPYQIVGVMPEGFWFPQGPPRVDLWIPLSFEPDSYLNTRKNYFLSVIARLKPGATVAQAQSNMDIISRQLADSFRENAGSGAAVVPFREEVVGDIRGALWIVFAAVSFVLLIACVNVANLLLARAASRDKEIAIRGALGANRARLVRQLLVESVLVALIGGALGLALTYVGVSLMSSLVPGDIARGMEIKVDVWVLAFTFLVSLVTGVAFGLVPALQASKPNLTETLKEGGRSGSGAISGKVRGLLVVTELALATVLLVGAGLMIKSVLRLLNQDPGFQPSNSLTMLISLPDAKYATPAQKLAFYRQLIPRLESLPGAQSAAASAALPLTGGTYSKRLSVEGGHVPSSMGEVPTVLYRQISPGYFRAMGMNLRQGRHFTEQDNENAPGVAIVNEAMVKRFFSDEPLGKRIWLGPPESLTTSRFPRLSVVGVTGDVRYGSLDEPDIPTVYVPHAQGGTETLGSMYVVVRTQSDPLRLTSAVRQEVWSLDRTLPVGDLQTLEQRVGASLEKQRFYMILFIIFGTVALVLAAVGVYGLLAYLVTQRTREFGIRMALGAQQSDVRNLVLKQAGLLALTGVVIGLVCAFVLTRAMSSLLYEVSAGDLSTYVWVALVLIVATVLASYLPTRRAMRVDPIIALRHE